MRGWLRSVFRPVAAACSLVLVACGGGTNVVSVPQRSPLPSPSPVPTPGTVMVTPSSLTFVATGPAYAQTVTATQANFSGLFSATTAAAGNATSCSGIVTVAATSATSFAVTPVAAGSCVETIAGGGGEPASLPISVATTSVGGM